MSRLGCTECGRPVRAGQGRRHLSCSPVCTRCSHPITSRDDSTARDGRHGHCVPTTAREGAS
ncbi:DNA binding protein [Gordonia phage Hibiscus]|uniref:DNA binding protein n=2 Tax=Santhisvirus TaxID=3152629 RepID=A0AAE7SUC7_9CAUD|nr:hypothetical protein QLQ76_gp40 [Gordonia phage Tarzan]YP_010842766.1 DNA binding protein [Gordonia phage Jojo24]QXO13136.1 DNA binding protein [Gordonia phage Jojo24]WGH20098.1 hypothetical protein [Gordonia phage Tarzan]